MLVAFLLTDLPPPFFFFVISAAAPFVLRPVHLHTLLDPPSPTSNSSLLRISLPGYLKKRLLYRSAQIPILLMHPLAAAALEASREPRVHCSEKRSNSNAGGRASRVGPAASRLCPAAALSKFRHLPQQAGTRTWRAVSILELMRLLCGRSISSAETAVACARWAGEPEATCVLSCGGEG